MSNLTSARYKLICMKLKKDADPVCVGEEISENVMNKNMTQKTLLCGRMFVILVGESFQE